MQVHVKTRNTQIDMKGNIPKEVLAAITKAYKNSVKILNDDGEEIILAEQSRWFQEMNEKTTPGRVIQIYRENLGWSQSQLGKELNKSIQYISDLENGRRNVSLNMAKKLAEIFEISIERLIK